MDLGMAGMKAFLVGIVLGLAFVLLVHSMPPQPARQLIALFLAPPGVGSVLASPSPG